MSHTHKITNSLVTILKNKTGKSDDAFFTLMSGFYLSTIASMMRCSIRTHDDPDNPIPVNMYALLGAGSGYGKTFSTNTLEAVVLKPFLEPFLEDVFTPNAHLNTAQLANRKANREGLDTDEVLLDIREDFEAMGAYVPTFDSATSAAIKQLRSKLLYAKTGSLNLIIDELGSNLTGSVEALVDYLSLYDKGLIKQKIIKATKDNKRGLSIEGSTPANLLMFGTPTRMLDGAKTEEELMSLLSTGYARRLFFGFVKGVDNNCDAPTLTAEEIYDKSTCKSVQALEKDLQDHFELLASPEQFGKVLTMSKQTAIRMIQYRMDCETKAKQYREHEEVYKAEMNHRYFKVLKYAGALAFVDMSDTIDPAHIEFAIEQADISGEAFKSLIRRERPYTKLAKYLSNVGTEVTQADLVEDLPFYSGSMSHKKEMMDLAIAYGYKNNIVIKRSFSDGMEFFQGESLKPTDLANVSLSYSNDIATGYEHETFNWGDIHELTQLDDYHFTSHALHGGHRREENAHGGTDFIILDVDGGVSIKFVQAILEDFTYHIYTTKRHTEEENRFRVILPLSHKIVLDAEGFKSFMENVCAWLAFGVDMATHQRARKWLTNNGSYFDNVGKLIDATQFVPKTSKAESERRYINETTDLTNLERWYMKTVDSAGRNNTLIKLAHALSDKGFTFQYMKEAVVAFNEKLSKPLKLNELEATVFTTMKRKMDE